jgi:hypothetical protein
MPLSAPRWKQFAESRYVHEREALEFLRDILQDLIVTQAGRPPGGAEE